MGCVERTVAVKRHTDKEFLMQQGRVKWFNKRKGFGFIEDSAGPDVFLHFSQITNDDGSHIDPGDTVQYETVPGEKGPKAVKVVKRPAIQAS